MVNDDRKTECDEKPVLSARTADLLKVTPIWILSQLTRNFTLMKLPINVSFSAVVSINYKAPTECLEELAAIMRMLIKAQISLTYVNCHLARRLRKTCSFHSPNGVQAEKKKLAHKVRFASSENCFSGEAGQAVFIYNE